MMRRKTIPVEELQNMVLEEYEGLVTYIKKYEDGSLLVYLVGNVRLIVHPDGRTTELEHSSVWYRLKRYVGRLLNLDV